MNSIFSLTLKMQLSASKNDQDQLLYLFKVMPKST